jgi:3-methyladenine DNA glycosylase AlkD
MRYDDVMKNLSELGNDRIKKRYMSLGAKEPLFGVTISAMKPLAKKIMHDNALAKELYNSGNYDAMYLAGMIVDSKMLTEDDFEDWMSKSYCNMIGYFIVSIVLAESDLASKMAMKWIKSKESFKVSTGYNTYAWVLGYKSDNEINFDEINELLDRIKIDIDGTDEFVQEAMDNFLIAVGISYKPLSEKALNITKEITGSDNAAEQIENAISKGRLGFKRKNVRC